MSKKGKRLREFEKNNRTFNISEAQQKRANKRTQAEKTTKVEKKKTKVSGATRLVVGIVLIVAVVSVSFSAAKIINFKSQRDELLEKNQELTNKKEDLTQEFENITSTESMEQAARKKLKMIKDNEILFLLPEEEESEATTE
jgi:cell division protein FtsB